ncbi:GNAT family N-acetyltransferase [Streptomyces sp. SBT349]|uniref:GNAT family N-acetyltransferase n=1 Tax=Streptomyces sp. SBT349 TaxID=1580539 RepID=UPI00066B04B0|nr:GNAT family N-acetyltransferase [Streptomyces sp. SBT349]
MSVEVRRVREVGDELVAAMAGLLPQLSPDLPKPTRESLTRVVEGDSTVLLVAEVGGRVVGTLTLLVPVQPSGVRARVEDVVVDEAARGRGAGRALMEEALRLARELGAGRVDLTSNPRRTAAHRLYEGLGFTAGDSRVYWRVLAE